MGTLTNLFGIALSITLSYTHDTALAVDVKNNYGGCATIISQEEVERIEQMLLDGTWDDARMYPLNQRGGIQQVRITAHIVRYSDGSGGIPQNRIDTAISNLNVNVASTGLVFFQDGPSIFLDNDIYADCDVSESVALRQINVVNNSLNIWFVPNFTNGNASICGQSSTPANSISGIVMKNSCVATTTNNSSFTHEAGHYFGLLHTHDTQFGAECVDGSNCSTAGDLFCDTPADPGLDTSRPDDNVDFACNYFGTVLDACGSGNLYFPQTDNFMSYSFKLCRDVFTLEQLSTFLWSAENDHADHIVIVPVTWTVDVNGGADFTRIQDAVVASVDGDEVLVMPGTYIWIGSWSPGYVVNTLGKSILIRSQSGSSVTFIDGENLRRGVLCQNGGSLATVIDGFTIRNCMVDSGGSGLRCENSNLTVLNCNFVSNKIAQGFSGAGGGLLAIGKSTVLIDNCDFISNVSSFGGGIGAYAGCDISILNCEFRFNRALGQDQGEGGGISFSGGNGGKEVTSLLMDNCILDRNYADYGAGIVCSYSDNVLINDCTIIFNEATFTGGGIECDNVAIPILTNTIVCDNTPDQINGNFGDLGGNTIGTDCGIPSSSDIDGDGIVGVSDLLIVIEYWGTDDVHADLDGSGIVDVHDILIIVADWGPVDG